jgi:hypothetical protein
MLGIGSRGAAADFAYRLPTIDYVRGNKEITPEVIGGVLRLR